MNYASLLKNLKPEEIKKALEAISEIQSIEEKFRNCFFWKQNGPNRPSKGFKKEIIFELNSNKFCYQCEYSESWRHCYFSKEIYFNKDLITMRTINTLEKKLTALVEIPNN